MKNARTLFVMLFSIIFITLNAEIPKLVTQLYGDRMMIANATGCSSIYSGSAPSTPYTTNEEGKGPAWANSLFEDNAEFGFGFVIANASMRNRIENLMNKALVLNDFSDELKELFKEWIENKDDGDKTKELQPRLIDRKSVV